MALAQKKLTIVGGPNGSGKTTFVQDIFPDSVKAGKFINADHFALEISPENTGKVAVTAGKRFIKEVNRLLTLDDSFIIETTLAGKSLLKTIEKAKENDFIVRLIFLWIDTLELCDFRIKGRVAAGGHNIPFDDIVRRYKRGLQNFEQYYESVHECKVYFANEYPIKVFSKMTDRSEEVEDKDLYSQFKAAVDPDAAPGL